MVTISINTEFFICFDEGEIVIKMNTYSISEEEAEKAANDELEAERIARLIQSRR